MVSAALPNPSMVGWSGTLQRKLSRANLNWSTEVAFMFLMEAGNRLKSLQPFTAREASLALLMGAGADIRIDLGVASLPFLAQSVKVRSYPCTFPSLIFQIKITM